MRTNVVIDDELIEMGMRYTGLKTKKDLINYALREMINRKRRKSILTLEGKLRWEGNLSEMRKGRFGNSG